MFHLALIVLLSLVRENRADQHSRILDHHLTRGDIASTKQATPVNWRPWLIEKEDCYLLKLCFRLSTLELRVEKAQEKGRNFAKAVFVDSGT